MTACSLLHNLVSIDLRGVLVQWPTFFQLPVLMLMLITLLNDGTLISIGYDNVIPNPRPDKWNLRVSILRIRCKATCFLLIQ